MNTEIDLKVKTLEINDILNCIEFGQDQVWWAFSKMFLDNSDVVIIDKETWNQARKIIASKIK